MKRGEKIEGFKAVLLMTLVITSLTAFSFVATIPDRAHAVIVEDFYPTDDGDVAENFPDEVVGGVKYNMYSGWAAAVYLSERLYLKFDLSKVPAGTVSSAVLRLNSKYGPSAGAPSYLPTTHLLDAIKVEDDDWQESTLTWNNAPPPVGSALDTENFQADDWVGEFAWYEWDVTSFVQGEVAGDKIVSICLKGQNEGLYTSAGWIYTKDSGTGSQEYWPALRVTYSGVEVGIEPSKKYGLPGEDITFTVTIRNETGAEDSFYLTTDKEWPVSLPSSVGPLPDGSSEDVTLTVTAPEGVLGVEDVITVTATSFNDPTSIYNSKSCTAATPPIWPAADTYIIQESPSSNLGAAQDVYVGTILQTGVPENCRGYWKFDLRDHENLPSNAILDNVYLSVFTHYGGENGGFVDSAGDFDDTTVTVTLKEVSDDTWEESMITWNNAPSMGGSLDSAVIPPTNDQRYAFDTSSFAQGQSDMVISLGMISENEGTNALVPWTAKESEYWEAQQSYLIVYYHLGAAPENRYGVNVSISPPEDNAENGQNVTFTVTITNTGNVTDTYTLVASDNQSWTLDLASSSGSLAQGASVDKTLTVTIPSDADNNATDSITVTATSTENTAVDNENSCIARCIQAPPAAPSYGVQVSISPASDSGLAGSTLTYTVTVKNTGTISDTYTLENSDNAGWTLSLSETSVGPLSAGASDTVTLSVTIPAGTAECTHDSITVTATSTENTAVDNENSCIAHAIEVIVRGVEVSISPSTDDGDRGDTITFTVTVTNTGNVAEDYNLSKTDDASWSLTLPSTVTGVAPDQSKQVTLTVGIPATAENCTRDNITVTATSSENTAVENSATCTAHCLVSEVPPAGVQVTISEDSKSGAPGGELNFYVTVTNTGTSTDTFTLTVSDTENWGPTIAIPSTTLAAGASRSNIKVSITIPSTAAEGDSTTITVQATSQADPTVIGSDTCAAAAGAAAAEGMSPLVYVGAAVVVIAIIAAVFIVKPF